jgi:glutamate-ammonia-ligase adenylyltransferase
MTLESFQTPLELPFVVMALGRLGHTGMDYGSDLDLLVVFDDAREWSPAEGIVKQFATAQEFYAQFTARLSQTLSTITREGFIYRVDLRLRPEGKNGQLAQGLNGLLAYLSERASAWEHSAYLKVREVSGDLLFGARVRAEICETIFAAAAINPTLKADLAAMRRRLEREKAKANQRDLKWGAGGMTDVYFITRYIQLRDRLAFLPQHGTAALIKHLGEGGALDFAAAQKLFDGYSFLRRTDHWMRLLLDRPTSILPASQVALADLAQTLGLPSIAEFDFEFAHHTNEIRLIFNRTFA